MLSTLRHHAPPRRWVQRGQSVGHREVDALRKGLRLPTSLCRLLAARGYDESTARTFLRPRLDQLHDPFELIDLERAVERIETAIEQDETILVHGDYDVDGISTTALFTRVLRELGATVEPFVPHRTKDGYDLGPAGIAAAQRMDASLILTGDCGITAHDAIEEANSLGIDVIVTDHHTPGPTLPPALAVINPKRADCDYPFRELAGVGVAFKLCQGLYASRGLDPEPLGYYLDLVALATIADLVPLQDENRVFTHYGLRVLAQTRNPGLQALMRTAGVDDDGPISAGRVGYVLAPRINAVGRMDAAEWGLELLLTESTTEAASIAEQLEEQNRLRQAADRKMLREALSILETEYDPDRDYGVVVAGEGWHPGVIGIVASRIVEQIHRPTVLIALDGDGPARGSARSIRRFHLYDAIAASAEHLDRFGGHKAAAGLDIQPDRVDAFRDAFNAHARAVLEPDDLVEEVAIDLEITLAEADRELYDLLQYFGPFGLGNPTPVLVARGVQIAGRPRIVGDAHLKLDLIQDGVRLPAIGFQMADRLPELEAGAGTIDVAFRIDENRWNGRVELQAKLVDIELSR